MQPLKRTIDVLAEEVLKMRRRKDCKLKTRYSRGDMPEEYGFDFDRYNSLNRGTGTSLKNTRNYER